jgi:hypothetical protein
VGHLPTLASHQDVDAPKAKAHTGARNLPHSGFERLIKRLTFGLLIPPRSALKADFAGSLNTDTVTIDKMADERFALHRPQSFMFRTSCSMTLSRLRSATNCLGLWFSYSSCRILRNSATPTPAYFFFQA